MTLDRRPEPGLRVVETQPRVGRAGDCSLEPERYELDERPAYRFELERREFIAILGAGLVVSVRGAPLSAQDRRRGGGDGSPVSERIHVGADGVITVLTGKVEVGQGSRTQITAAAAEELGVAPDAIRLVMADTELTPDDGGTSGSRTTPSTVPQVRRACAAARRMLLDAAAEQWKVERDSLSIRDGHVVGPSPEHKLALGVLVMSAFGERNDREVEPGTSVRGVEEWKVLGTSVPRAGAREIVTGAHRYPSDIRRPTGTLFGAVLRPPTFGARLESIDLAPAKAIDGVVAVHDGEFVGFAAPTSALARRAAAAVASNARWIEESTHSSSDALWDLLRETAERRSGGGGADGPRGGRGRGSTERGSVEDGLAASKSVLRAEYRIAYIQHAPMEPRAACAEWNGDGLTVWTGTQNPDRVRSQVAEAFRTSARNVRVIVPDTGGGFGGKHTGEVAIEAARLARAAGKPVSLTWTREEEFSWAYFRPAGLIELAGGVDGEGRLVAWEHTNINSGGSAVATPYDVPNVRARSINARSPLRQGSYRALASTANVFARECFLDELAAQAGVDPLAFRRMHLSDARLRAVLERAAERFGFERRRKELEGSKTRGAGIACGTEKASFVATCAEVEVDRERGTFRVVDICAAFECGAVQNPANLRAQVEGCIVQGLGGALREEIRFSGGKVRNASFARYRVPRFRDLPPIDIVLVDRRDLPSVGAGETPIVGIAPAIANALFAATGEATRSLPIHTAGFRAG